MEDDPQPALDFAFPYRTAKGSDRIVDKGIEFEQVDRESVGTLVYTKFLSE